MPLAPLISVIVPIYNVEKFLPKCMNSIFAQTYQNLEIILVDDGSTDSCGQMCDTYATQDKRTRVIHQQNAGLSAARNAGIRAARGAYLSFIDADDWVESAFLEILWQTAHKYQASITVAGWFWELPSHSIRQKLLPKNQTDALLNSQEAYRKDFPFIGGYAWNKLYRRDLFREVAFPEGVLYEDMYTNYRLFNLVKTVALANYPLYHYNRTNPTCITKTFSAAHMTYFTQTDLIVEQARRVKDYKLIRIIQTEQAYHAAGFLRKIIVTHTDDAKMIATLQIRLRRLVWRILCRPRKITLVGFALVCCVNFNLAKRIYGHVVKAF